MKVKTAILIGAHLDWAVAKAQYTDGRYIGLGMRGCEVANSPDRADISHHFSPSTNWSQGGPIIERERIATQFWVSENTWEALIKGGFFTQHGPTPLIAAMRCYVASKLGEEAEVPEELCE